VLYDSLFRRVVRRGTLVVIDAHGKSRTFAGEGGPRAAIRLHEPSLHYKLAFNPRLYVGEAYMNGTLTIEEGTLYDFLELCSMNLAHLNDFRLAAISDRLLCMMRLLHQYNPVGRARKNVAHHYDLSGALYDLFLDRDRQYSCAYFCNDNESLEVAQDNKKRLIAAKLLLEPGHKVLDIGSGWGGLAIYLAKNNRVDVTGVTLSTEQEAVARERAAKAGLTDHVHFHLRDYRNEQGKYDRIVSVGMFEHVGVVHYREYFAKIADMLTDDGVALLHSIGRIDPPGSSNPWMRKYIFPGGYVPALSEVFKAVEKTGLWVTDVEVLRLHYAETLREWNRRFQLNRDKVKALYDERFCRMWEFYLQGCEVAFRHFGQMVFQMQLAKNPDAVPLTRDYLHEFRRAQGSASEAA